MHRIAIFCMRRGWWWLAAWVYRRAHEENPEDAEVSLMLATCEAQRGRHDEALRLIGRRQSGTAVTIRIMVATHRGLFDEALEHVDTYLRRVSREEAEYGEIEALRQPLVDALEEQSKRDR